MFASQGADVLAVDRPGANLVFDDKAIRTLECDVSAADAPAQIVDAAIAAFGKLDILYNNAGVSNSTLAS